MQLIIFAGEKKNNVPFALESLVMIVREREMMWQVSVFCTIFLFAQKSDNLGEASTCLLICMGESNQLLQL